MKKERIVAFCIGAVLLGTVYAHWISWFMGMVEPSSRARSTATMIEWTLSAWPPIGVFYPELQRWNACTGKKEGGPGTASRNMHSFGMHASKSRR